METVFIRVMKTISARKYIGNGLHKGDEDQLPKEIDRKRSS
ncbi:hypothetical protein UACE39S_05236 [Ureibacillus acetophenoni]